MIDGNNSAPRMLNQATFMLRALLVLALTIGAAACSTQGPSMSGLAIGNTRMVSVNDIVTLRSPLSADGRRRWRVTEYDSRYLTIDQGPRIEVGPSGTRDIVTRARALIPGVTEVKITEIAPPPGKAPSTVRFKVRITQ